MRIHAFHASDLAHLRREVAQCSREHFRPTLAIVFASVSQELDLLCDFFNGQDIVLFGCTTAGEITNGQLKSLGISVMLFEIPKSQFKLFSANCEQECERFDLGQRAGAFIREAFEQPAALVLSSGVGADAEALVEGIKSRLVEEVPIFGGLAGDDLRLEATYCLHAHGSIVNGTMVLAFDGEHIELSGLATSGWQAIGTDHVVTSSKGNVIYSINNEPALEVFIKYFGYFDNTDVDGQPISSISAQYPLQFLRPDGTRVLRSPLFGNEEDGSLVLAGGVKEGDRFRFSISPGDEVIDQTIEDFGQLKERIADTDALILFSCKGRHAALGPLLEDEITGLHQYWNRPMIGFLSYGEIGPTINGTCDFHNETCSLVLIRKK